MDPMGPRHGTPRSRSETYALYVTGHLTAFPPGPRTMDHAIPITYCECSYTRRGTVARYKQKYRPVIDQSVLTKKKKKRRVRKGEENIIRMSCEERGVSSKRELLAEGERKKRRRKEKRCIEARRRRRSRAKGEIEKMKMIEKMKRTTKSTFMQVDVNVESPQQQSGLRASGLSRFETALLLISRQPRRSAKVFSSGNANSINRKRFSAVDTWASAHNVSMHAHGGLRRGCMHPRVENAPVTAQRAIPIASSFFFRPHPSHAPCPATKRANCFDPCFNCPETAIAQEPTIKRRAVHSETRQDDTHTRDAFCIQTWIRI
ncbi:hypothetical protein ALC62_01057 [Cyphomyrmex costatus]|uniref:Uncharacterized protein n=1 Tax=Cyphomyrmex costatus TaxID=456900 RepID=A0A151IPL0_9HYME|nr:hypothetical protein ALC62_01057 [Cyphomyrmex costatus]